MALKWFQQPSQRACVVGLDGVPCSMIRRFVRDGVMPRLGAIIAQGALHETTVSLPEISSVSWSTFMTGRNPGEHGVFGFTDLHPGTYTLSFPSFRDLKCDTIWDRMGEQKMRSVVVNQPATYPARPVHGALISGFVAVHLDKSVFPARYLRQLREMNYEVDLDAELVRDNPTALFRALHELLAVRERITDVLWSEEKWNLMEVVVTGTDRLHHFLFDAYEDEGHPQHAGFLDYYRAVDAFVGRMYDRFTADSPDPRNFFVLSDHGFCRTRHEVNINRVLSDGGHLVMAGEDPRRLDGISEAATAFGLDPSRIYLHRRGRYPRGGVSDGRADALLDEISEAFLALRHDGEAVIRRVFRGRDVYRGPASTQGPDLILLSTPGFDLKGRLGAEGVVTGRRLQGMHTWDDAFVVTTRTDLVPAGRDLTLLDVPAMVLQSLHVEPVAS
ncbi:MAG TPA: alkaline phosphatase family protein [Candidatus Krumholzibacteria bacterium]|nr:alkaline phosphatase family protein [Candidatus Krumholzibacteria bacterium]